MQRFLQATPKRPALSPVKGPPAKKARTTYTKAEKLEVVEYAKWHGNTAAARHFNSTHETDILNHKRNALTESTVRGWRSQCPAPVGVQGVVQSKPGPPKMLTDSQDKTVQLL